MGSPPMRAGQHLCCSTGNVDLHSSDGTNVRNFHSHHCPSEQKDKRVTRLAMACIYRNKSARKNNNPSDCIRGIPCAAVLRGRPRCRVERKEIRKHTTGSSLGNRRSCPCNVGDRIENTRRTLLSVNLLTTRKSEILGCKVAPPCCRICIGSQGALCDRRVHKRSNFPSPIDRTDKRGAAGCTAQSNLGMWQSKTPDRKRDTPPPIAPRHTGRSQEGRTSCARHTAHNCC